MASIAILIDSPKTQHRAQTNTNNDENQFMPCVRFDILPRQSSQYTKTLKQVVGNYLSCGR